MYQTIGKRLLDLFITIPLFFLFIPIMLLIALLVHWRLGAPVLFRQQRPGYFGIPFTILKFRTMIEECDHQDNLLPDSERLSKLGTFLRRTSLDELPEMWNVIKGEMSLVGPRPLLMHYLDLYTPEQMRRHDVKPGITGWAQVNGRNTLCWEEKFDLDIWYVDNYSLRTDLKIIVMTVSQVIKREGISQSGYATAQEFKGKETP